MHFWEIKIGSELFKRISYYVIDSLRYWFQMIFFDMKCSAAPIRLTRYVDGLIPVHFCWQLVYKLACSKTDFYVFSELSNDFLPLFNTGVGVISVNLRCAEDYCFLILHVDSNLVIYVRSWSLINSSAFWWAPICETYLLDLQRSEVDRCFGNVRLVEMKIVEETIFAQGHSPFVHKEQTLLS